jgi:hypothetical protein
MREGKASAAMSVFIFAYKSNLALDYEVKTVYKIASLAH